MRHVFPLVGGAAALTIKMELYTEKRGCFNKRELAKLATALGFPSDIFFKELSKSADSVLRSEYASLDAGKSITEMSLRYFLESGLLNYRLEKIFNKHDAHYNVQIILKAICLLHHRQLSYCEIAEGRLAFEVYSSEDGSGLAAELETVAQTLKMMGRVMAPSRLEDEIQKQQHYCELPSRIRLHEFYELVTKCSKSKDAAREMELEMEIVTLKENGDSLPDISKMLTTTDQQVVGYLEERYKTNLVKTVDPSPAPLDDQRVVSMAPRRTLRSLSKEHSWALVPPLERSQQLLHQARNGIVVFTSDQYATVESYSRPSTSLSEDYRTTREVKSGKHKNNHHRRKQTVRKLPPMEDTMSESKSAPNILINNTERDSEDDGDISDTISKICVGSVERAREALSTSFACLPQHTQLATSSTLPMLREDSGKMNTYRATACQRYGGVALTAIVTKKDIARHQDRISELEWETLTKHY